MSLRTHKLLKWTAGIFAGMAIAVLLLIGAFRLAISQVPEYRVQVQSWISERTRLAVEFGRLSARLRLYGPELVFDDAIVSTPDRTRVLVTARRGALAFDLWASLSSGRLTAGRFSLEAPQIGLIRTREGRIQIAGQSALPQFEGPQPFAIEHLPVGRYRVTDAHVTFSDEATGRGPWALSGVSFELNRNTKRLELQGDASLPSVLGGALEFQAQAQGALEAPADVVTTFAIAGNKLDLAGWADVLPDEWLAPETGRGSLKVAGRFEGPRLAAISAAVDLHQLALVPPPWSEPLPVAQPLMRRGADEGDATDPGDERDDGDAGEERVPDAQRDDSADRAVHLLSYERAAFNLNAERNERGWHLALSNVEIAQRESPESSSWRASHVEASWARGDEGVLALSAKADRIALDALWPLLAYLPESAELARIRALEGGGTVHDLAVTLQRERTAAPLTYSLQARLDDIRFAPVERTPGLSGISGELQATESGGRLELTGAAAAFDLPRLFRAPLRAESIDGLIAWEHEAQGWRVVGDELSIRSPDGSATARFEMKVPADGSSPVLDLTAEVRDIDASATRKYLPAGRLRAKSLAWLDRAFVRGRVPHAELVYRGPVKRFPFRNDEGSFLARGSVTGMTFAYHPGWMPATDLSAAFEFRNAGLYVRDGKASVGGLQVAEGMAEIPDFKLGQLAIRANGRGDLEHALRYLQASTVAPALGEAFGKLRGNGELQADVDMRLPLKNLADRAVTVRAHLAGAAAEMEGLAAPAARISGTLTVRHTGIEAADLQGWWLGGPATLRVSRPAVGAVPQLTARGRLAAAELASVLNVPDAAQLTGGTHWRMQMQLAREASAQSVAVESDLRGLGIGLPEPLGKPAAEVRPLRVELQLEDRRKLLSRVALGDLRALLLLQRSEKGWRFDRGSIRADRLTAALPDHAGLRLEGTLERLELDEWFKLRGAAAAGDSKLSDYLRAANLRIGTLELFGYEWSDVRGLLHARSDGWRVDVAGPMAQGELIIPYDLAGRAPITAKLERLSLSRPESKTGTRGDRGDPRRWPAIDAHVGALQLGASRLGTVDLEVVRVPDGIRLETLTAAGEGFKGNLRGQWLRTAAGDESRLELRVASTDVGAALHALGYAGFMEAKQGEILADLSWPGGFDEDFVGRASGTVSVSAQGGQLLNVQPGAGRLLGLLSVAALPRRLALDFSDLTDKGLSFDTVHGDFELRSGNAYTRNLLLRGPAAEIGIAGRTGLGSQDYDQTAVVTGNLGASLPVAGALAGGPAVGAALLLFSQVFKEPLKGMTRGYYRITGTWENPVIERVDAAAVEEASARNLE